MIYLAQTSSGKVRAMSAASFAGLLLDTSELENY